MRDKTNTSAPTFKMEYHGREAYHFSENIAHESPCMSEYWRRQPIRSGNRKMEE